ncbi:MAG: sugar transferase [Rhodothermales bacterium]
MDHLQLVAPTATSRQATIDVSPALRTVSYARRRLQNGAILALGDLTTLLLAATGGLALDWSLNAAPALPVWMWWLPVGWVAVGLLAGLYPGWGMGHLEMLRRMLRVSTVVCGVTAAASLWATGTLSWPFYTVCICAFTVLPALRARTRKSLQETGAWGIPVLVYGAGDAGAHLIRHLRRERSIGYNPVAVVDDNPARHGRTIEDLRVLGRSGDRVPVTDTAVLAMPHAPHHGELLERLSAHYRSVIILDEPMNGDRPVGKTHDFDGVIGRVLASRLDSTPARVTKRAAELLVLIITSPFWLPLLALVALAVWLEDRRSPIMRQVRMGWDGTPFSHLRFRTVVPNTGERLRESLDDNEALRREWETRFRLVDDPRVSKVGRVIRTMGLVGLPQLLNVMRGDMALVGSEPLAPYRYSRLSKPEKKAYATASPAVTGLWNVYGETPSAPSATYYVRTWTIERDLAILMKWWVDLLAPATS